MCGRVYMTNHAFLGGHARQQLCERYVQPQRRVPRLPQRRRHAQPALGVRPDQRVIGQRREGLLQPARARRSGHARQIPQSGTWSRPSAAGASAVWRCGSASPGRTSTTDAGGWRRSASSPKERGSGGDTASARAARTGSSRETSRPLSQTASADSLVSGTGHLAKSTVAGCRTRAGTARYPRLPRTEGRPCPVSL